MMAWFDPVPRDHVNSIKMSQDEGKYLQAKDIQNKIISLWGNFVRDTIVSQITETKTFCYLIEACARCVAHIYHAI